jgi:hypothetical protein
MSKNKKALKPAELLEAIEAHGNLEEAKAAMTRPANNLSDDILNMVISQIEELPEVGLMAQLVALEEEAEKAVSAASRKQLEKQDIDKRIARIQRDLMDTEINARAKILNREGIAGLQARFGQFFQKVVAKMVEEAKMLDATYQERSQELKDLLKASAECEKSMKALTKTGKAHVKTGTQIEKQLKTLLANQGE